MKKKMIALSLSLILLSSCGSSKSTSNSQYESEPITEQEHHEKVLNGLLFTIIVFAIFSAIGNKP